MAQVDEGRMLTERDSTRLLESFQDTSIELAQGLDLGRVMVAIVERSMNLTGARYGAAVTLAGDGTIESFLHRGLTAEEVALLPHLPLGKGLLGVVLDEGKPVRCDDMSAHPSSVGFPTNHVPMKAFLGVPIQHGGKLVGALYLTKPPENPPFTQEDEDLACAMGAMAAVGIQNARLYAAETQRAERNALIRRIASRARSSLDVNEVLSATVEALGHVADVERCYIRLVSEVGGDELGPIAAEWEAEGVDPLGDDPERQYPAGSLAARHRTTQSIEDIAADERLADPTLPGDPEDLLASGARAALATPIEWGDELIGVVAFHSVRPRGWTDLDVSLIEGAARELAVALHHARLYEEALHAAARLRQLDQMRSDFITMVSHELRSPMTVVAGIADILRRRFDRLSDRQREDLIETLGREARRLTRLVSEVLDLEAIDQGSVELRIDDVDVPALARESIEDAREGGRTELVVAQGDTTIRADRDKIKQVLLNLISNAVKFSKPADPITVRVVPDADAITVSVSDGGPGIPPDERHRLFKRFSRIEATGADKPGSGLGLYLAHMILEQHGGEIWLEDDRGPGATFAFRIPR